MKSKTLLASVATLVASLTISLAASTTVPLSWGLTCISNPYNKGTPLNRADQVLPYADGNNIQIWSGSNSRWEVWTMDSLSGTGWLDPQGNDAPLSSLPILSPGIAFFYGNNIGTSSVTFTD